MKTFGNLCQSHWTHSEIFKEQSSHIVYHNIIKITDLLIFLKLNWSPKLRENNGRKNTLVAQVACFQMLKFDDLN